MRRETPRRRLRPRRPRSSRNRRAHQPHLHLFMLYGSVAALLALALLAFSDAEPTSMRARRQHHAGQGHARPSDRRDAAAGRERLSPAASSPGVVDAPLPPPQPPSHVSYSRRNQPRFRVEGTLVSDRGSGDGSRPAAAGAAIGGTRSPGAGAPYATAFVASSPWPAAAAGAGGFAAGRAGGAAASSSSWVTRPRRRDQPTQGQRQHGQWLQNCAPGPAGPRGDWGGGGDSWGGGGGRHTGTYNCQQGPLLHGSTPPPRHAAAGGNSALFMGAGGEDAPAAPAGGRRLTRPPLLITIGPQCAGKTSLLKGLAAKSESEAARDSHGGDGGSGGSPVPSVTDVTIDDHPSVRPGSCRAAVLCP